MGTSVRRVRSAERGVRGLSVSVSVSVSSSVFCAGEADEANVGEVREVVEVEEEAIVGEVEEVEAGERARRLSVCAKTWSARRKLVLVNDEARR